MVYTPTIMPIATRFILIISLLMSMQASASMSLGMIAPVHGKSATVSCTDMNMADMTMDMSGHTGSKLPVKADMSGCHYGDCCLGIMAMPETALAPTIKPAHDFPQASVSSPTRFIQINYRPPILS